jgi:tetraprenyl-beta-curcumene synthase
MRPGGGIVDGRVRDRGSTDVGIVRGAGDGRARGSWRVGGMCVGVRERLGLGRVFVLAALRYWLTVFPRVRRELACRRRLAAGIGDPVLQRLALEALGKRGNVEGAAAFAAFVPRRRRAVAVRALVALQAAYDYADLLAEQPCLDPVANGRRLHTALLVALDPGAVHPDYYEHHPQREESGYLEGIVDDARAALGELPSYPAVAASARSAAARIVDFQSLSLGGPGERGALARYAWEQTPRGSGLYWWETAAAGGSSLGLYALIAAATERQLDRCEIDAIEGAYFPWVGAFHSLLDSLVDEAEDAAIGQLSLVGCYASREQAASRLGLLAARAVSEARGLPCGRRHAVLVAGMAGYYLSAPEASAPGALALSRAVRGAVGGLVGPSLLVFDLRRRRLHGDHAPRGSATATAQSSGGVVPPAARRRAPERVSALEPRGIVKH